MRLEQLAALNSAMNFAGFNARSACFDALNSLVYKRFDRLQIWQKASFILWIIMRTQERIITPSHRTFTTYITTLSHNFLLFSFRLSDNYFELIKMLTKSSTGTLTSIYMTDLND
jgi:hypothetical protein